MSDRAVVLDPLWAAAGHARPFRRSFVTELDRRGIAVDLVCNDNQEAHNPDVRWTPIPRLTRNHVVRGRWKVRRAIRALDPAAAVARVDLAADLSCFWHSGEPSTPWVRILHRVPQAERHHGRAAPMRELLSRSRAIAAMRVLERAAGRGDTFVVHTERALQLLTAAGVPARLAPLPYLGGDAYVAARAAVERPYLLIIGPPTAAKGVPELLRALDTLRPEADVWVTKCSRGDASRLEAAFPHLRLTALGALSDEDYRQVVAGAASLAIFNDHRFRRSGAASAVVVDAVVHGVPALVGPGVATSSPCRANLVEADLALPATIREGLDRALSLARMEGDALAAARQTHSMRTYVDHLLTFARTASAAGT